jgi:hypothetical protein
MGGTGQGTGEGGGHWARWQPAPQQYWKPPAGPHHANICWHLPAQLPYGAMVYV